MHVVMGRLCARTWEWHGLLQCGSRLPNQPEPDISSVELDVKEQAFFEKEVEVSAERCAAI